MKKITLLLAATLFSSFAFAGNCEITVDRKGCPGKEKEAHKPYDGKNPTTESQDLPNEEACKKAAKDSAEIARKGTLAEKIVTAKFDGKSLGAPFKSQAKCTKK